MVPSWAPLSFPGKGAILHVRVRRKGIGVGRVSSPPVGASGSFGVFSRAHFRSTLSCYDRDELALSSLAM